MRRNRIFNFLLCSAVLFEMFVLAQTATAADLELFQRYFGTMDYSVTGTGSLKGSGKRDRVTGEYLTGKTIPLAFPRTADLVGAFLYWGSHEISPLPSSARAYLSYPTSPNARVKILGKPVGPTNQIVPCWNTGGSNSSSGGGAPFLRLYRADILRYLKAPGSDEVASEITVRLRDGGGTGGGLSVTEGASVVLIYRHPALSFKSIVIFDGAQIMGGEQDAMSTVLKGFDQATQGEAKLTHIVANGQQNFSEVLSFNGTTLETNPFQGGWDNKTYNVSNLMNNVVGSVNTTVSRDGTLYDCLSRGAVVFSTTVLDTDQDGLLDIWETSGYKDLDGNLLVNLPAWVAGPLKKDLLAEIDYMYDNNPGLVHSHRPKSEALQMVGDAFKNAPVGNPDGSTGIHVVFDVGVFPPSPNPTNIVGNPYLGNPYVATSGALEGGDPIDERGPGTYCTTYVPGNGDIPARCMFPNQAGLISWKKGFQRIKNHNFLPDRTNLFHYVVFGHGLALKKKDAVAPFVARSVSGRADLGGNSVAVTVGLWRSAPEDALVGSTNLQAATFLHELSHNLYGFHGGITLQRPLTITDAIVPRPNCNPNNQSSLNYMYQSAGLLDALGIFRVNLSGQILTATSPAEDERDLDEAAGLGAGNTAYRLRWYAPIENLQGDFQKKNGVSIPLPAARSYCDGSNAAPIENSGVARVDGEGVSGNPLARMPVDWNADGTIANFPRSQDINFNGKADNVTPDFAGFNDWKSIIDLHGLQQVGAGRNLFGLSLGVAAKHLLQAGEDDLGEDDLGEDDLGEDDLGEDDLGEDDLGEDDLGEDDLGQKSEMDEDLAIAIGGNGPTGLTAVLLTGQGPRRIQLTWTAPAFGGAIDHYSVYRSTDGGLYVELTPTTTATSYIDDTVGNNKTYRYRIIAVFGNPSGLLSNPSNTSVPVTP